MSAVSRHYSAFLNIVRTHSLIERDRDSHRRYPDEGSFMRRLLRSSTMIASVVGLCVAAGVAAADTQVASAQSGDADIAAMKKLYVRPTETPSPADNTYTPAKAELGKTLFFDPRLSRSGVQACVSC